MSIVKQPSPFWVHLALWIVNIIYALSLTITKEALPNYIQPSGFILLRISGALFCSLFLLFFIREKIHSKQDWITLFLCAVFGVATNMIFFFQGLARTSPINAGLIMVTTPILVLLIGYLLKKELLTTSKLIGILLGTTGAGLLILNKPSSDTQVSMLGDTFIFINATSYAIYLVMVKGLMKKYHPLTIMLWTFIFGWFLVLPFGYSELVAVKWSIFNSIVWFSVLFTVIATTFVVYVLNSWALKHIKSTVVSSYIYLQPLLGTLFATLSGKYAFKPIYIFYALLIFSGVYLVSKKESQPKVI